MTKIQPIDWFIMLSQAALLIAFNVRFGEVLGGSMVFFILIIFLFYFSYFHRVFQEELSRLSLAAVSLVGLNVVAQLEHVGTLQRLPTLIAYVFISLIFSTGIYQVNTSLIRVRKIGPAELDPVKVQLIKNIAGLLASIPTVALLMFVLPSGLVVWIGQKSRLVQTNWVTVTTLAILSQIIGAVVHGAFLKKITDAQVVHVLKVPRRIPIQNFKQKVTWALLVLFVLGSVGEVARGLWFFWMGSFTFWALTLRNSWRLWRHVFASPPVATVEEEGITPGYNILQDFRIFLYAIVIAALYGIGLVVLLALTTPKSL